MNDEFAGVREATVKALNRHDDPDLVAFLIPLVDDRDQAVRRATVAALEKFSSPQVR
jgi:HEAT repeat protein